MMKSNNDGSHVARVNKACPICGKVDESQSEILFDRRLRDISKYHNQTIGFGDPCAECQAGIDQGAIMLIIVDAEKSSGNKLHKIYRTGNIFGLTEDWARRALKDEGLEQALKDRFIVMDYKLALQIGLPVEYNP